MVKSLRKRSQRSLNNAMIELTETYTYSNWKGKTAQRKIKQGDTVHITFLGASEEEIRVNRWNPVWETDETIDVMGENYYFEVVVNEKRAYYGKYADYRHTKASNTMGGGVRLVVDRTCISDEEVKRAFAKFKDWLYDGAKENNYWHGLYKKKEFPEKIAYGMPGEETAPAVAETTWKAGEVIEEGDGVFTLDGIRYEVVKDYEYDDDDKRKTVSSLKVLPLKGEAYSGKVTIPEVVSYHRRKLPVTEVDNDAFDNCPELTEIVIPCTVTWLPVIRGNQKLERITVAEGNPKYSSVDGILYSRRRSMDGAYSTLYCYPYAHRGEHFVFPEFVDDMVDGAFEGCQMLKSVVISNKVTRIADDAFKDCTNLESITWGAGLQYIWRNAFENCTSLKSITFPDSIKDVSRYAFLGCTGIESITFAKGKYFDLDGLPKEFFPWGKDAFILNGVRYKPDWDFYRKGDALLVVTDPYSNEDQIAIDDSIQTVKIPAKIEHYGYVYEVSKCTSSFKQFPSLKRLELPSTIKSVDIEKIKSLQEVVVDNGNTDFLTDDGMLFEFKEEELVLLGVPRGRDIKRLVVPDGVVIIAEGACRNHPFIEEVVLPDSVKKIEKEAFASCSQLREVHLGKGVEKIGVESFAYTAIEKIVLPPSVRLTNGPSWDKTPFFGSKLKAFELDGENELYTVIDGCLYIKSSWGLQLKFCPSAYEGHLHIPEGCRDICMCACLGCTELKSVYIPDGMDTIGDDAFSHCEKLENVEFDGHVRKIGGHCFFDCTSLKEIDCIGVRDIEDTAFRGIKGLKLNLPYALECNRSKYQKYIDE